MIGNIEKQPSKKLPDRTNNPVIPSLIVMLIQYSNLADNTMFMQIKMDKPCFHHTLFPAHIQIRVPTIM